MAYPVSKTRFAELVEQALEEVPSPFKEHLAEISVEIRQSPSDKELHRAGVGRGSLLLGLYHGRPRTQRSVMDDMVLPDIVYIFQRPIEAVSENEQELVAQVRTTVLHEVGHHFGMSEDDLDKLGYG